jgi:hypothetical protein
MGKVFVMRRNAHEMALSTHYPLRILQTIRSRDQSLRHAPAACRSAILMRVMSCEKNLLTTLSQRLWKRKSGANRANHWRSDSLANSDCHCRA